MTDIFREYYDKQLKKGKRGGLNLPAMARRSSEFMQCIVADEGRVFVSRDVVALEPSVTAEISRDPRYTYATVTGIGKRPYYDGAWLMIDDIYLMSASIFPTTCDAVKDIFYNHTMSTGLSFPDQWVIDSEVCKDYCKKAVRTFAKVACLGIGYGMGARKFRATSEENGKPITHKEAKGTIDSYWEGYRGLKAVRDSLSWQVERHGHVVNQFGYRCTPDAHKAFNAYIQSSASGVLDVWIMKFFAYAPYAQFICLIHDEILFSIPKGYEDRLQVDCKTVDDSLNADLGWEIPIRWGTKIATSFAGLK